MSGAAGPSRSDPRRLPISWISITERVSWGPAQSRVSGCTAASAGVRRATVRLTETSELFALLVLLVESLLQKVLRDDRDHQPHRSSMRKNRHAPYDSPHVMTNKATNRYPRVPRLRS